MVEIRGCEDERKNNRNKGFTFIELILYMAILGIFMVAVMSLISSTVASKKTIVQTETSVAGDRDIRCNSRYFDGSK